MEIRVETIIRMVIRKVNKDLAVGPTEREKIMIVRGRNPMDQALAQQSARRTTPTTSQLKQRQLLRTRNGRTTGI